MASTTRKSGAAATLLEIAIVALAYILVARIGLKLDAVGGFATLVWPASGIALAALLLLGFRLWPAVAIGAFTVNYITGAPLLAALGIAAGNTAEALVGAYLVTRVPGFRRSLDRVRDMVAMIILAAGFSTLVAATVGVTTLVAANVIPSSGYGETWKSWWVGDAIGDLLVAPLILVWASWKPRLHATRVGEALALTAVIMITGFVVFSDKGAPAAI